MKETRDNFKCRLLRQFYRVFIWFYQIKKGSLISVAFRLTFNAIVAAWDCFSWKSYRHVLIKWTCQSMLIFLIVHIVLCSLLLQYKSCQSEDSTFLPYALSCWSFIQSATEKLAASLQCLYLQKWYQENLRNAIRESKRCLFCAKTTFSNSKF